VPGTYTVVGAASNFDPGGPLYGYEQTYDYDGLLDNQTTYALATGENFRLADFGYRPIYPEGTGTPGYWKNHPEAWPVDEIVIGGQTYTKAEAIAWMNEPDGDKTVTLFRALVSAKLNVGIGNDSSCIEDTIRAADGWLAQYPVGSGVRGGGPNSPWRTGEPLYLLLDDYNNGLLPCADHRS
jgi:hypothetical protein